MAQVINMSTSLPGFSENYFCDRVAEPEATRNKLGYQGQGGHDTWKTGKTGNLVVTFSRQGKHREFCSDTGKIFGL